MSELPMKIFVNSKPYRSVLGVGQAVIAPLNRRARRPRRPRRFPSQSGIYQPISLANPFCKDGKTLCKRTGVEPIRPVGIFSKL